MLSFLSYANILLFESTPAEVFCFVFNKEIPHTHTTNLKGGGTTTLLIIGLIRTEIDIAYDAVSGSKGRPLFFVGRANLPTLFHTWEISKVLLR